jgi:hypothetical protein
VTHEYVIGLRGIVGPSAPAAGEATAIAWAADRVLAVGADADVRSISRGDSIFLDLAGCTVTPLPDDPARAGRLVETSGISAADATAVVGLLADAGLLAPDERLEPGSPANLACWGGDPAHLLATVVAGAFTEGDEHHGPFYPA